MTRMARGPPTAHAAGAPNSHPLLRHTVGHAAPAAPNRSPEPLSMSQVDGMPAPPCPPWDASANNAEVGLTLLLFQDQIVPGVYSPVHPSALPLRSIQLLSF